MDIVLFNETVTRTRLLVGSEQQTVTIYKDRLELRVQNAKSADVTVVDFAAVERYWLEDSVMRIRIFGAFLKNGVEKVSELALEYPLPLVRIVNILYLFVPTLVQNEGDLSFRRRLQNSILDEKVQKGVIHFEFGANVKFPNIYVNRCVIRTVETEPFLSKTRHDLYLPYDKYEIYFDINDEDSCQKSNPLIVTLSEACPEISLSAKFGMVNLKLKQL